MSDSVEMSSFGQKQKVFPGDTNWGNMKITCQIIKFD